MPNVPTTAPTSPGAPPLHRLLLQAADCVQAVQGGHSLTDALGRVPPELRPGTQALSFTALRRLGSAQALRQQLAPKTPPPRVDALLLTALALLWDADDAPYAEHTLVDQAVQAAKQRAPASQGFINAVLRRFLREREALSAAARRDPLGAFNHPLWWLEAVKRDWPAQWQDILAANNRPPPMVLRVNARRTSASAYLEALATVGISARLVGPVVPQAIVLDRPHPVQDLPGFAAGDVSVQDAAAQLAAHWLAQGLAPGARVLDACAAPGGKTAHLLELQQLDLLALDADGQRLQRVQENLLRLSLRAQLKAADARQTATWWDGRPFDAILLDAPCSAAGIVRRHPDVRWLRRPDDIRALAQTQAELLDALWPLLQPGGRLLYATCSIFRAEGQAQADAFLQRQSDAQPLPLGPLGGHLLPVADNGRPAFDGFFYAHFAKRPP
jgi:16S rRNA (cytosine967-C5)-methyltransferase